MVSFNDVNRAMERLKRLKRTQVPPELVMNFIQAGDEVPEPSPWALTLYLENKEETLGH
jgi:hypothetical protein